MFLGTYKNRNSEFYAVLKKKKVCNDYLVCY